MLRPFASAAADHHARQQRIVDLQSTGQLDTTRLASADHMFVVAGLNQHELRRPIRRCVDRPAIVAVR